MFGCRKRTFDMLTEEIGLVNGLTVPAIDHLCWSVGANDQQRHLHIVGFKNGRVKIGQSRTTGTDNCNTLTTLFGNTQSDKSRCAFVYRRMALDFTKTGKSHDDGGIATTRTDDSVSQAFVIKRSHHTIDMVLKPVQNLSMQKYSIRLKNRIVSIFCTDNLSTKIRLVIEVPLK